MSSLPCRDCAGGALHGGTPTGSVKTLHGLPTYVAEPPAGEAAKGIVVIIPDAFGWELVNNRIMADSYAQKGKFQVLLPDFMNGHWLPHDLLYSIETMQDKNSSIFSRIPSGLRGIACFLPFLFFNRFSVTGPRIHEFLRQARASTALPVGAAGFCWGGKWVTLLCSGEPKTNDGKPLIDAGYTAHPSFLAIPDDITPIKVPYSVAYACEDMALPQNKWVTMKAELDKKSDICEYVEYEGAKHGFAVRGDPDDEKVKRQGEEAEQQAIRFFSDRFAAAVNKP